MLSKVTNFSQKNDFPKSAKFSVTAPNEKGSPLQTAAVETTDSSRAAFFKRQ